MIKLRDIGKLIHYEFLFCSLRPHVIGKNLSPLNRLSLEVIRHRHTKTHSFTSRGAAFASIPPRNLLPARVESDVIGINFCGPLSVVI
jgi:hypothetical protein